MSGMLACLVHLCVSMHACVCVFAMSVCMCKHTCVCVRVHIRVCVYTRKEVFACVLVCLLLSGSDREQRLKAKVNGLSVTFSGGLTLAPTQGESSCRASPPSPN